jgi:hypothetical protein
MPRAERLMPSLTVSEAEALLEPMPEGGAYGDSMSGCRAAPSWRFFGTAAIRLSPDEIERCADEAIERWLARGPIVIGPHHDPA